VRELSEIAMTGAAWITEHELHYIVNLVRELEADDEFHICKNNEYVEQIAKLEAELKNLKQKELKRGICGLVNIEDFQEVRAERDRLKADLSTCLHKQIQMALDALIMKRGHAALVEVGNKLIGCIERNYGNATGLHINIYEYKEELKAALAEVK
jgi:hypothetical protein